MTLAPGFRREFAKFFCSLAVLFGFPVRHRSPGCKEMMPASAPVITATFYLSVNG